LGTPATTSNAVVTGLPTQIPYSTKQGIIFAEQEIWAGEQGILSAEMKWSPDVRFSEQRALDDVCCCPESGPLIAGDAMSALPPIATLIAKFGMSAKCQ
jgi:hypothetical protein